MSGVSPQDAPLFEINDLSGETELTAIGMVVLSDRRRNGWRGFPEVEGGVVQLAGNSPA